MTDPEKEELLKRKLNLGEEPLSLDELRFLIARGLTRIHCNKCLRILANLALQFQK